MATARDIIQVDNKDDRVVYLIGAQDGDMTSFNLVDDEIVMGNAKKVAITKAGAYGLYLNLKDMFKYKEE